jgi:FtsH-binding integral membrane protein
MRSRVFRADSANSSARWLWYALIGVCLVIALVMWASSSPGKYDHRYDGWAQFAILTACVFGYLLKWGWHYKGRAKFWGSYLIAFLAHCAVFVTVLSRGSWHILLLGVVGSLEIMGLATLIALAMGEKL